MTVRQQHLGAAGAALQVILVPNGKSEQQKLGRSFLSALKLFTFLFDLVFNGLHVNMEL